MHKIQTVITNTLNPSKFGVRTKITPLFKAKKGLNKQTIIDISKRKNEPSWMLDFRLKSYKIFLEKPLPKWGPDLSKLNFENIHYYLQPQDAQKTKWEDVPSEIKKTFDRLGIPEAEKRFLAGTGAQFESEVIYHSLKKQLEKKGVIFESTDSALKNHPEFFKKYFGKVVPPHDNKFSALNSAVWSGGSFIYVPKNVHIDLLLHAYFRINDPNMGQFERTLIIADEGSSLNYVEGCSAPIYKTFSLHSAVVEIIAHKNSHVQYTTIQNWSKNIYNLVTKRAHAYKDAQVLWLDCNLGTKINMKYPAIYLLEEGAKGEIQSFAIAGKSQNQDTGARIIHTASNTSSKILSKSISKNGGRCTYRGLIKVNKGIKNIKAHSHCDALIMDNSSSSDAYPALQANGRDISIAHEATVSKINEEQLFYLMSRGLNAQQAYSTIINGFAQPIIKQFPLEYAVEINRLLEIEI